MKAVLRNWNSSKKIALFLYGMMFLVMFLCNLLTPYVVDDFSYRLSFATGQPLTSVWDIFASMAAHAQLMNGRLSAHFLVQLFSLFPKQVFDLVNAGFFCLLVWLISSYASVQTNNLLSVSVFCAIWMYEPAFGQVNLWQDGSINYLWSAVFCLMYIKPFVKLYMDGAFSIEGRCNKVCFFLYSIFVGSYSEAISAAAIFVSFVLMALSIHEKRARKCRYAIISIILAVVGYLTIYLAPAQWANKGMKLSIISLVRNVINTTNMFVNFGVLVCAAVVLFVIIMHGNTPKKKLILGIVCIAGSLVANYIMIAAICYPERAAIGAFILLLTATAIWISSALEDRQWQVITISVMAVLVLSTVPVFLTGTKDIAQTYQQITENEQLIYQCKDDGIVHIELPFVYPQSEYSAVYDLKYLDAEDATSWPNSAMAVYYGVDSIIGVK